MDRNPIDTFDLKIERIDITFEGDDVWLPEIVRTMNDAGFSMKGGFYVFLSATRHSDDYFHLSSYVPVAKRFTPRIREPECYAEALEPQFMEYCCFLAGHGASTEWGASIVNSIIAANEGQIPEEWLAAGMAELETPKIPH